MRFSGKRVLVTGANRNLGFGLASAFLAEGATVFVNASTEEKANDAVTRMRQATPAGQAVPTAMDVRDEKQVVQTFQGIGREYGGLDVLVNNAAVQGVGYTFIETPDELVAEVFAVNVFGYFRCAREAAKIMGEGGAIVNISSNTSERAIRKRSAYVASKGAIDAMTRGMAIDLAPLIRVNTVAPGYITSDRWAVLDREVAERRRRNVPLGAEASWRDIAEAVLFMASDAARHITGARLVVDGGCHTQHMPADADG